MRLYNIQDIYTAFYLRMKLVKEKFKTNNIFPIQLEVIRYVAVVLFGFSDTLVRNDCFQ